MQVMQSQMRAGVKVRGEGWGWGGAGSRNLRPSEDVPAPLLAAFNCVSRYFCLTLIRSSGELHEREDSTGLPTLRPRSSPAQAPLGRRGVSVRAQMNGNWLPGSKTPAHLQNLKMAG